MTALEQVDYSVLDAAKSRFIDAARSTLDFASAYGSVPSSGLGASANLFAFRLAPYVAAGGGELFCTLVPEGLGTADDARPDDLTPDELRRFWRNVGWKVLSSLTNDAASAGLQTVLIGLYLPSATPADVFTPPFLDGFLSGVVEACRHVGCVYLSGETPELRSKMVPGRLDVAGSLFAVAPPGVAPVDGGRLGPGDHVVLVESSGPHENGFTPLRALAARLPGGFRTRLLSGAEFWEAANAASRLYTPLVQSLLSAGVRPTAAEHVTGHGWQKLMRSSKPLRYVIEELLPVPEIFQFVQAHGHSPHDMLSVFNYGAGFALYFAARDEAEAAVRTAAGHGLRAVVAGRVEASARREVVVPPLGVTLTDESFGLRRG